MIVYAESSAVVAWVLNEPRAGEVGQVLDVAEAVVASVLTPVECARTMARGLALGGLTPEENRQAAALLESVSRGWVLAQLSETAMERAKARFPREPVRTLDALHLATALEFQEAFGSLALLSLDERIRANAQALGMVLTP